MFFRWITDGYTYVGKCGVDNNYRQIIPFGNYLTQKLCPKKLPKITT